MGQKTPPESNAAQPTAKEERAARLKAALKANMGRRKAQARARKAGDPPTTAPETNAQDGDDAV